jgi:biotin carboxyl carrier protein
MKMENELTAPIAGRVTAVWVRAGSAVTKGTVLVEVSAEG